MWFSSNYYSYINQNITIDISNNNHPEPNSSTYVHINTSLLNQLNPIDYRNLTLTIGGNIVMKQGKMAHIIVETTNKILYCGIPKNGCSIFKLFFYLLHYNHIQKEIDKWKYGNKSKIKGGFKLSEALSLSLLNSNTNMYNINAKRIHFEQLQSKDNNYLNVNILKNNVLKRYANILNNKSWRKLIVIRDPLERLLSGFINKCFNENNDCFGYKTIKWKDDPLPNKINYNFSIFINHFMKRFVRWEHQTDIHAKWNHLMSNHFSPQYSYCNLQNVYKYYTDIMYYKQFSIANDVEIFLNSMENINVEWFYNWGLYHNQTMFNSKYIHATSSEIMNTNNVKKQAEFYRLYYHDKLFALKVMKIFQKDYEFFNIPYPKWIDYL